jgi:hypothetical protein
MTATRVIFRADPTTGEVVALMPDLPFDIDGNCTAYSHAAQHFAAGLSLAFRNTRPATPDECAELKAELERQGYMVEVGG